MLTFVQNLPSLPGAPVQLIFMLTAEERARSRHRFYATTGEPAQFQLPRGTLLKDGDLLRSENGDVLARVQARAEPVLTVTTDDPLALMRAAYHLGNRHVPVEIGEQYLRLAPDHVLAGMLKRLGLHVCWEMAPFHPEAGAYGGHSHG